MNNINIPSGSIIVAADGSADADRAVRWAAEQASVERRQLIVLTVAREMHPLATAGVGSVYVYPDVDILQRSRELADAAVELAVRHRPGLRVEGLAVTGEPSRVLIEHSADAHLLVVGSRGRGTVRSKVLGSVSASVSRHARCPVVVCRPGSELKVKNGVVVGADATRESLPVLDFAFRQASLRSLPLTVLHCHWDVLATVDGPRLGPETDPALETSRLALAESVAGFREQYPDVHTTVQVARGLASEGLAAIADRHDLVVIGRHPVDSISRRVVTATATSVIERCHTNVAVVPEGGAGHRGRTDRERSSRTPVSGSTPSLS